MQDNQVPLFRFAVVEIDSSIIGGRDLESKQLLMITEEHEAGFIMTAE